MSIVKGYKVFNPDWTCRGFQYEVGGWLNVSDDDARKIMEEGFSCESRVYIRNLIEAALNSGDFELDGETYIPESSITDFNAIYGTNYDDKSDIDFIF